MIKNSFLKVMFSAIIAAGVLTLSGCFPTGEKDPIVSDDFTDKNTFEYEGENISVSFDIPETPKNVPIRIKLKEKSFDTGEMTKLFLDGKTMIEDETSIEDGIIWTTDRSNLNLTGNNFISFNEGTVCPDKLEVPENAPINYQMNLKYSKEHFRDIYDIGEEIEGFPSQNAIDRALELCSTLGITDLGKPRVYAFDLGVYEKYKGLTSSWLDPEVPFTEDNEVYILRFPQVFGGIALADLYYTPVNDSTAQHGKSTVGSPEVVVGVSRTGIFHFYVWDAYEAEYEIVSSEPIKYGLDYALSELSAYFERTYFKEETFFTFANVVYFPSKREEEGYIEYALAWCFWGLVPKEDPRFTESYNIVFLTDSGARIDYNY